ncbi:unnamed protein product [Amoebophrya sp. A25]|nr:unnamed protein product [Amoebophrya sp. A25]|eukprot:GSA25T00014301001.1
MAAQLDAAQQVAALQAMQDVNLNFQRNAAVHESEGLGVATEAQITHVADRCANLRTKCTPQQYLFILRQLNARTYDRVTKPPANLNLHPMALVATFRCADTLNDAQANSLMDAVSKAITGSLDPKSEEKRRGMEAVYDIFTTSLKTNLQNLPPVAADPPETFHQRQLNNSLVSNFLPDFVAQLSIEKRRLEMEESAAKAVTMAVEKHFNEKFGGKTKQMEQEIKNLRAQRARSPRRSPSRKGDNKKGGKGAWKPPNDLVCLSWMEGKCAGSTCPNGNSHKGELKKLELLNKSYLGGKITQEQLKRIAS